jgi:hypothetical protein
MLKYKVNDEGVKIHREGIPVESFRFNPAADIKVMHK